MKNLIIVFIFLLNLQTLAKADDIRDFQIEGMSIGDSLLDYFTNEEINNKKNSYNDKGYIYPERDYYSLTFYNTNFENYEAVQINLKDGDNRYIIHSLSGIKNMNIEECYKVFDSIEKEIDALFSNSRKVDKQKRKHVYDKTGKSFTTDVYYWLPDNSYAALVCTDWSENIEVSKNWADHMRTEMGSPSFTKWYQNLNF